MEPWWWALHSCPHYQAHCRGHHVEHAFSMRSGLGTSLPAAGGHAGPGEFAFASPPADAGFSPGLASESALVIPDSGLCFFHPSRLPASPEARRGKAKGLRRVPKVKDDSRVGTSRSESCEESDAWQPRGPAGAGKRQCLSRCRGQRGFERE